MASMRLFVISVCHMQPQMIAFSFAQAIMTMGMPIEEIANWTIVDHYWPIHKLQTSKMIYVLKELVHGYIIRPDKNLGGHGGVNFAVDRLIKSQSLSDYDLVLTYDPDSNPITPNWLRAMTEVMQADVGLDYLSLMHQHIVNNRKWTFETVAGHTVARDVAPEMFNVTLWRGKCIKQKLTAGSTFYGHLESSMWSRGFKHAYLYDFREDGCPIPHHPMYTDWKRLHASKQYPYNFDQYVKEKEKDGNS